MDDKKPKVIYPREQEMLGEIDGRIINLNSFRLINPNNIESLHHDKLSSKKDIACLVIKTKPTAEQNMMTLKGFIIKHYKNFLIDLFFLLIMK